MNFLTYLRRAAQRPAALRKLAILAGFGATLAMTIPTAQAVPSYARQTGSECASCHVGGFGPQLTPYGIRFKINGYTDTDGKEGKIPLSAMMVVNATRTKQLTNFRVSGKEDAIKITPPIELSLEYGVEFIDDDELLEITPTSLRVRKRHLKEHERKRASRD